MFLFLSCGLVPFTRKSCRMLEALSQGPLHSQAWSLWGLWPSSLLVLSQLSCSAAPFPRLVLGSPPAVSARAAPPLDCNSLSPAPHSPVLSFFLKFSFLSFKSLTTAGDLANELVRHFLIECTPKGVRLKGCSNEPYFGK